MRDFIDSHPSMSPCTFEPLQENKTNCIRIAAFTLSTFVCTFGIDLRSVSFNLNSWSLTNTRHPYASGQTGRSKATETQRDGDIRHVYKRSRRSTWEDVQDNISRPNRGSWSFTFWLSCISNRCSTSHEEQYVFWK